MPIILIALICSLFSFSKNRYIEVVMLALSLGLFFGFSIWHLNIDRVFTPVILFLACLVIGVISLARLGSEKLMRYYNSSRNKIIIR